MGDCIFNLVLILLKNLEHQAKYHRENYCFTWNVDWNVNTSLSLMWSLKLSGILDLMRWQQHAVSHRNNLARCGFKVSLEHQNWLHVKFQHVCCCSGFSWWNTHPPTHPTPIRSTELQSREKIWPPQSSAGRGWQCSVSTAQNFTPSPTSNIVLIIFLVPISFYVLLQA